MKSKIILFFLDNKNFILYTLFPLLFCHLTNCYFEHKYTLKDMNKRKKNKKKGLKSNLTPIYLLFIISIILLFFTNIPILKHIINAINFSFLIYILIIAPLFNKKLIYNFIESNTIISSFLLTELIYIITKSKLELFINIQNDTLRLIIIILFLFTIFFLYTYIFLINIKFILYYFSSNILKNINIKIDDLIHKLSNKYDSDTINKNSKLKNNVFSISIRVTKQLILFTLFIVIIQSLLLAIYYFIKLFINCFSKVSNNDVYIISKLSIFVTIFSIYLIMQISNVFTTTIISSYEFISSTIIIPLLLETLINNNNNNNNT